MATLSRQDAVEQSRCRDAKECRRVSGGNVAQQVEHRRSRCGPMQLRGFRAAAAEEAHRRGGTSTPMAVAAGSRCTGVTWAALCRARREQKVEEPYGIEDL